MCIKTLIIEDEKLVARHIAQLLEEEGYQVCAIVSDGETAIQKIIEFYPELILMDIRIKGELDGIEVAEHIRFLYDIPIVYLTAFSDPETLTRAEMTNPSGYVIKPFRREQLLSTIRIALANHQAKRTQPLRKIDELQLDKKTASSRLKSTIVYIKNNLHHNINLELLSGSMGMTPAYFCRFFHKEIGCSPYQYIIKQRIEKAKKLLLKDRQLSINDIAMQCGFSSHSQLDRHFRKLMGITPKEYRN
ncbi:MAG: hypothetical protein RLZZ338_2082 [Cyanobacteriota bacterium]|jgi:YesN/AraC family two-component response regulator